VNSVLAFTPTYGDRMGVSTLVSSARSLAGMDFDWLLCSGAPTPERRIEFQQLYDSDRIQRLVLWAENRGQHHATYEALEHARAAGYDWFLRIDDDITFRTPRWLLQMVEWATWLHDLWTKQYEMQQEIRPAPWPICSPYIAGLLHPIPPQGDIRNRDQTFRADLMPVLGGACRLHRVNSLRDYSPDLYAPLGRWDPERIRDYAVSIAVPLARFPDIRVLHDTARLEKQDTPEQRHLRRIGRTWCWLGEGK
jgi:glycosyltransferase involved in cell wall biosynthesis